jgi:hypothetical protein
MLFDGKRIKNVFDGKTIKNVGQHISPMLSTFPAPSFFQECWTNIF